MEIEKKKISLTSLFLILPLYAKKWCEIINFSFENGGEKKVVARQVAALLGDCLGVW